MNNLKPGFKKGEGKLAGFITKLLKKINRQQPKLEIKVGHSVYPESYYQPIGKEHESREDWMRHWRLLGEELSKEGIDFNSAGEEQEKILAAAWAKVCRRMKNEKIMVYHAQQAKENHISQDLVGDSITLRAKQQPERC